jgi:hypothetical protein
MVRRKGCIKTGCNVRFVNYGKTLRCDLFRVGDCYVVKTRPGELDDAEFEAGSSWEVDASIWSDIAGNEFWGKGAGVFVVPDNRIKLFIDV